MTPEEVRMCVADVMQDDEIENVDSIIRMLNNEHDSSWRAARGSAFTSSEIINALEQLMALGLVTPCAEQPPSGDVSPIAAEQVPRFSFDTLWFHLEPSGRHAVQNWWNTEGCDKFPIRE